jgi:hypothetical protein
MRLLNIFASSGPPCSGSFFGIFPTWYEYLPSQNDYNGHCQPQLASLTDIWLILAAIIEILLRVAAIAAVAMVIYGGIQYTTSQGSPEATAKAKSTIINALIGLAFATIAATLVAFLAGSFS